MASPEQEAFITEMLSKKPGEIWLELWEARQILGLKGVGDVETPEVVPSTCSCTIKYPLVPRAKIYKIRLDQEDVDDLDSMYQANIEFLFGKKKEI